MDKLPPEVEARICHDIHATIMAAQHDLRMLRDAPPNVPISEFKLPPHVLMQILHETIDSLWAALADRSLYGHALASTRYKN